MAMYGYFLVFAAVFHPKAAAWVKGRQNFFHSFEKNIRNNDNKFPEKKWIWFHCASLGEFEQGRNLIEKFRENYGHRLKILITFYSPSGFEVRKNYPLADYVSYLPLDTPDNARRFLEILDPLMICFVKYELWYNFLHTIQLQNRFHFLIAARWHNSHAIFRFPLSLLYKDIFKKMSVVFTQDEDTQKIIEKFCGNSSIYATGDTRYDRVAEGAARFEAIPEIAEWVQHHFPIIVVGSSWAAEESLLAQLIPELPNTARVIIAPHEINPEKIKEYLNRFPTESVVYSALLSQRPLFTEKKILWIDHIGLLSRLYYYSDLTLIGGGFNGNLHNILEPCVFGNFVVFGDKYNKKRHPEAKELIQTGGAATIADLEGLKIWIKKMENPNFFKEVKIKNQAFVRQRTGATDKIYNLLKDNFMDIV